MGTVQIDGSTPKLTIGNATAEDATILFDGNAQDFYIALDDSADDLLIGLGSTVGTTPIIAIDENKLSTFSGAITVGVDDTGHDVKFFGATASSYMLWDESANSLLLNASTIDLNGTADGLILDADADTTISSPTDDQIDIEIAGADDFKFTANTFTAISGSDIVHADTGSVRNRPNVNPLIINGNQSISQRTTSVAMSNGVFCTDRYKHAISNDGAATITQESLSSGNAFTDGFANALKIDVTTADGSLSSAQHYFINYSIEGQDIQNIKKGTANAEKLTLAFWVKATKTGTNIVRCYTADSDRSCSIAYTVSSSDTWEKKILNFPADTTGTVIADDNTSGMDFNWGIAAGSNYTSGTLATAWAGNTSANDFVGQVNNLDSTSNNFHITGIQLEVGEYSATTIPPFQHESYGDNLLRCQRYYNTYGNAVNLPLGMAAFQSTTAAYCGPLVFPVDMRAIPSITLTGGSGSAEATAGFGINHSASSDWFQTFASSFSSTKEVSLYVNANISGGDGDAGRVKTGNTEFGRIEASAEL
jgi:hypothetical protein